jgi:hypothetical protein
MSKSFLVLFFKKEQKKGLLFEKRSKNFCTWYGGYPVQGLWHGGGGGAVPDLSWQAYSQPSGVA